MSTTTLTLESLREALPDAAKDIRLNLQSVLEATSLTPQQTWGVALASAVAAREPSLRAAVLAEARERVEPAVIEDAFAAAALMAMNNVYYRFRHVVAKPVYATKSPRLRMNRLAHPAANKLDFELFCLAVSAINNCEACVQSHEKVVVDGGLSEDQVHDAVRVAAVINAAAVALSMADAH